MLMVSRIAPIFAVANCSVTQCGTLVAQTATFSPFFTPMAMRPLATRSTVALNSLHVSR